jgi:streptogramin lyase
MRPALIRALLLAAASTVAAPALSAQFTHFQTPTPNSGAFNIASGADGNVWFTEPSVDKIGRVNLQQGRVDREFPLHPGGFPMGITAGPDGNIWFTEFNPTGNPLACHIGRLNLTSLTVDMEIPTSGPLGITKGPDGNIWFTEQLANKIGCVTPTGSDCINQIPNTVAEFPIPPGFGSDPTGIASGPDNNIWFTELISDAGQRSYIGRLNLVTPGKKVGSIDHFQIPTLNSLPAGIVSGPDRNLWFTEQSVGQIGQFQMATAKFLEFGSLYAYSSPQGISAGPDGAIWFTETDGNAIGKMGTNGSVLAQYQIPIPNSGPTGITVGPDGNIWFTGTRRYHFPILPVRTTSYGASTQGPRF